MSPYTWHPSGRLSQLATDFSAGVYLFVHAGTPRRVIYVGTARRSSGFTPRWCGHLSLFACGTLVSSIAPCWKSKRSSRV